MLRVFLSPYPASAQGMRKKISLFNHNPRVPIGGQLSTTFDLTTDRNGVVRAPRRRYAPQPRAAAITLSCAVRPQSQSSDRGTTVHYIRPDHRSERRSCARHGGGMRHSRVLPRSRSAVPCARNPRVPIGGQLSTTFDLTTDRNGGRAHSTAAGCATAACCRDHAQLCRVPAIPEFRSGDNCPLHST